MNSIIGTWYFPHLLSQDDPRVEYIKFTDKGEYIYNDGLGRLESTYTLKNEKTLMLKSPTSPKELQYEIVFEKVGSKEILVLNSKEKGISFTLIKGK